MNLVIANSAVITMNPERKIIKHGAVLHKVQERAERLCFRAKTQHFGESLAVFSILGGLPNGNILVSFLERGCFKWKIKK